MARVKQLLVRGTNQPGTLAQVCTELAKVAVNVSAIMATPGPTGVIRIVAKPHATAQKVLDDLGMAYSEEEAITVRATDRPGALGRITRKLADAGINIEYAYGTIVKGSDHALIVLGVSNLDKADKLL
ncbi:MAG TPA: ACT domain-containing protein [Terriglobales bacterium]|jgi:hypothetical protein|nr:ACT domain-containing protein [Terriglobales bacterium]